LNLSLPVPPFCVMGGSPSRFPGRRSIAPETYLTSRLAHNKCGMLECLSYFSSPCPSPHHDGGSAMQAFLFANCAGHYVFIFFLTFISRHNILFPSGKASGPPLRPSPLHWTVVLSLGTRIRIKVLFWFFPGLAILESVSTFKVTVRRCCIP